LRGAVGNVTRWFRHLFVAMCRRIRFGPSGVRHLFVLKLLQHHCSERSSVALLCKLDDLPGNETCCGRQLYVGDRTQVWRHGHTGFLRAPTASNAPTTAISTTNRSPDDAITDISLRACVSAYSARRQTSYPTSLAINPSMEVVDQSHLYFRANRQRTVLAPLNTAPSIRNRAQNRPLIRIGSKKLLAIT